MLQLFLFSPIKVFPHFPNIFSIYPVTQKLITATQLNYKPIQIPKLLQPMMTSVTSIHILPKSQQNKENT